MSKATKWWRVKKDLMSHEGKYFHKKKKGEEIQGRDGVWRLMFIKYVKNTFILV